MRSFLAIVCSLFIFNQMAHCSDSIAHKKLAEIDLVGLPAEIEAQENASYNNADKEIRRTIKKSLKRMRRENCAIGTFMAVTTCIIVGCACIYQTIKDHDTAQDLIKSAKTTSGYDFKEGYKIGFKNCNLDSNARPHASLFEQGKIAGSNACKLRKLFAQRDEQAKRVKLRLTTIIINKKHTKGR